MLYERQDGKSVMRVDNTPKLDTELMEHRKNITSGSREYWTSLVIFEYMRNTVLSITENTPAEQRTQMLEMQEKRKDDSKRQHESYVAQQESHTKSKKVQEAQGMASDLFKNEVLHAGLVTSKQSACSFHAFTTALCAMADRPPSDVMNPRNIPSFQETYIPTITEDPSKSAVTDESDNAQINKEDIMKEEEETGLESGIASD